MDIAYEGDASGNRLPIQFFNSLTPPEFSAIQELVSIAVTDAPSQLEFAIYTDGSFRPTSLLGEEVLRFCATDQLLKKRRSLSGLPIVALARSF